MTYSKKLNKNGRILYEGPSMLDGQPIVVIAVGFETRSTNDKTGGMIQSYILRTDVHPAVAFRNGAGSSVCGATECPHFVNKTCYVNWGQGPRSVWECYRRGGYAPIGDDWHLFDDTVVRLGSAGDPCAAPEHVWRPIFDRARKHTGYTHQWRKPVGQWAKGFLQASCDGMRDYIESTAQGWRPFLVKPAHVPDPEGSVHCAASSESGKKTTCEQCTLCDGSTANVVINAHGSSQRRVLLVN